MTPQHPIKLPPGIRPIGIGGLIGSGKSLAAQYVRAELNTLRLGDCGYMPFADGIKRIAREEFGWDGVKDARGRRLLQVIGTECGRAYDEDIWIKKLADKLWSIQEPARFWVIDDCRFPNETAFIMANGGITMKVIGRSGDNTGVANHASETSLDLCSWTLELDNSDTPAYLADQVLGALIQHHYINQ